MKKILAMLLSVAIIATIAITGSVAYLTSTDSDINTMVMGNVKIEQHEKDRDGNDFVNNKPLYPAVYEGEKPEVDPNTDLWTGIVGAQDKIVSVKNTGKSEAYVRTWFAFEADAEHGLEHILINWNDDVEPELYTEDDNSYVVIGSDNNEYVVYCVTYPETLAVGETSAASLLQVAMAKEADNDYVEHFGETYDILVFTQAGQVENMSTDPKTALDLMFGNEHPWNDEDFKVETDIIIRNADELLALGKNPLITDTTIVLANDIDMNGAELKPMHVGTNETAVKVKFDGGNHTISNVKLVPDAEATNESNGMYNVGLFSLDGDVSSQLTVENLTLNKITVVDGTQSATENGKKTYGAAAVVGYANNNTTVQLNNVDVYNGSINNSYGNASVFVGYTTSKVTLTGCSAIDCTIKGQAENKTGTIVGTANTGDCTVTITDCATNTKSGYTDDAANDIGSTHNDGGSYPTINGSTTKITTPSALRLS